MDTKNGQEEFKENNAAVVVSLENAGPPHSSCSASVKFFIRLKELERFMKGLRKVS